MNPEGIMILDPGDGRAQKLARAMASSAAGDILKAFEGGPMPLSVLAERLDLPLNTAKYHVQNLLEAELLEICEEKYSVKGRKVKVYGLKNQVVIVAPKTANLKSLLLKYASLFAVAVAATLALPALLPLAQGEFSVVPRLDAPSATGAPPLPAPSAGTGFAASEVALFFFAGCCLTIALLAAWEWRARRRG
jgi:predicted transcriptional regulator